MNRNDATRIIDVIDARISRRSRSLAMVETTWGEVANVGSTTVDVYLYGSPYASEDFRVIGGGMPEVGDTVKVAIDKKTGDRWVMEPIIATGGGGGGAGSIELQEDGVSRTATMTTLNVEHGLDADASGNVNVDESELDHDSLSNLTTGDPHTQYQPKDSDLTAIAALATTSFGRAFLALADAAASRTYLGLGSLATASSLAHSATTGQTANDHHAQAHAHTVADGSGSALTPVSLAMGTAKITGVGDPTLAQDAATKAYVDSLISGLEVKRPVRLATNAALPAYAFLADVITASAFGALTIDGVAVAVADRILVKDESGGNAKYNGIYLVTATGGGAAYYVLTRSVDNGPLDPPVVGDFTFVEFGTANAVTGWVITAAGTIDVTAIVWSKFTAVAAAHHATHEPGGSDPMAVDAATGTGSLRTLGTGATQSAAGDHGHSATTITISFVIGDGGSVISTGLKGGIPVDFAGVITGWTILSTDGTSGAVVVDVWKDTYANFPPTVADTITGSEKPTITATGNKGQDTSLNSGAGWAFSAGDVLYFNVDSVTSLKRIVVALRATRAV